MRSETRAIVTHRARDRGTPVQIILRLITVVVAITACGCQSAPMSASSKELLMSTPALSCTARFESVELLRLLPDDDLRIVLTKWAVDRKIRAASILSAVGSVKKANLRFAAQPNATLIEGPLEVVALSGMLAASGVHLHMSVSDKMGKTVGGHLADGALVYTTLELAIGVYRDVEMLRQNDERTGFNELFFQGCR